MKYVCSFFCLISFIVSTPVFAGIGDKYICDVIQRPDYDHWDGSVTIIKGDPEDWAPRVHVKFFIDWISSTQVGIERIDILRGRAQASKHTSVYEVESFYRDSDASGFQSKSHNSRPTYAFDVESGNLFIHDYGAKEGNVMHRMWYLNCAVTSLKSVDEAVSALSRKTWPKYNNNPFYMICNLKALTGVNVEFTTGDNQLGTIFHRGAVSKDIFESFLAKKDTYENILVDNLREKLPLLEVHKWRKTKDSNSSNVDDKYQVNGSYSCMVWTQGNPKGAIALNVSCELRVHNSDYDYYDFPDMETMKVTSREMLEPNIVASLRFLSTQASQEFAKEIGERCRD
jgi:hypothetical protein